MLFAGALPNPIALNITVSLIGYAAVWFLVRPHLDRSSNRAHSIGISIAVVSVMVIHAIYSFRGTDLAVSLWMGCIIASATFLVFDRRAGRGATKHQTRLPVFLVGISAATACVGLFFSLGAFAVWYASAAPSEKALDADRTFSDLLQIGALAGFSAIPIFVLVAVKRKQ